MSESSAKSSQPLASKGEKDVSEKRGRGRPRKKPQVCGVPYEKGWDSPRVCGSRKPPTPSPLGWGHAQCSPITPLGSPSPGLTSSKTLLGGSKAPPELLAPPGGSPAPPQALLNLPLQTG